MCILSVHTLLKVVGYYDLSVLSMSMMGFKKKLDLGWVGGWGELYPSFFCGFLVEFVNFAKPLSRCECFGSASCFTIRGVSLCVAVRSVSFVPALISFSYLAGSGLRQSKPSWWCSVLNETVHGCMQCGPGSIAMHSANSLSSFRGKSIII